jgi:hypothetical protein
MDDMDDANRIHEYIQYMRNFAYELERMSFEVQWINNEEQLFQFPETTYPRLAELKDNIMIPFYDLLYRGYRWQRDVSVWLDGPFEYLDSSIVDNKTTEYFQSFSKISKTFKTKIKMQMAMNYPYRYNIQPYTTEKYI